MPDFLDRLARDALETIDSGYYEDIGTKMDHTHLSLTKSLRNAVGNPIIGEVKAASPSKGSIKKNLNTLELAGSMINGGVAGLSVLTEPKHFKGSISHIAEIREAHSFPILMKDFVLHTAQIKTARKIGASAVLLISKLYNRGYGEMELPEMIDYAHREGLEVLLESHSLNEFKEAAGMSADLIGINNRDLKTLRTDLKVTEKIMREAEPPDMMVVSESGIETAIDIRFLRNCGAEAFLVGSAIMASKNPESKVRELVEA
jgi:indole-3-glycerol phosphate synthase